MRKLLSSVALILMLSVLCCSLSSCIFFAKDIVDGLTDGIHILETADEPYRIIYDSKEDGTCTATVTVNSLYREEFEIVIPDQSPEGDTVTCVYFSRAFVNALKSFPSIMTAESFSDMMNTVASNLAYGSENRIYTKLKASYFTVDLEKYTPNQVTSALENYPFTEHIPKAYVLDTNLTPAQLTELRVCLQDYMGVNVKEFAYSQYCSMCDILVENGVPQNKVREYFPKELCYEETPTSMYVKGITFPKGLQKLREADLREFFVSRHNIETYHNGESKLIMQNYAIVPEGANDSVILPLLASKIETLYLLDTELPEPNDYFGNQSKYDYSKLHAYSETEKEGCWRYVDGIPTEW